ncbi:MAG: hypothetical protein V4641_01805 [Pseudomonadota bacterium]
MPDDDASNAEMAGEAMAYRIFWTGFGQKAILLSLISLGTSSESPQAARLARYTAYAETLRVLRVEMLFPVPPGAPAEFAKVAGAAFHRTFLDLEEKFLASCREHIEA